MDHGNFNLEKQVATEDTEVSEKKLQSVKLNSFAQRVINVCFETY
jgi:hypothetical protein